MLFDELVVGELIAKSPHTYIYIYIYIYVTIIIIMIIMIIMYDSRIA